MSAVKNVISGHLYDLDLIKLLAPLGMVPDGETITKRTGETPYVVRRTIIVIDARHAKRTLDPLPGTVFLDDAASNDINAAPIDLEVVWSISPDRLRDQLDPDITVPQ